MVKILFKRKKFSKRETVTKGGGCKKEGQMDPL